MLKGNRKVILDSKEEQFADEGHDVGGGGGALIPDLGYGLVVRNKHYSLTGPLVAPGVRCGYNGEELLKIHTISRAYIVPAGLYPAVAIHSAKA